MSEAGLTLEQAAVALARCSKAEGEMLRAATPHECALMLEAKYHLDAKIHDSAQFEADRRAIV